MRQQEVVSADPLTVCCIYCERSFPATELALHEVQPAVPDWFMEGYRSFSGATVARSRSTEVATSAC